MIHEVVPGQRIPLAEGLHTDALRASHPNLSLIYRLEGVEKRVVYALDCELGDGTEERLSEFSKSCDLLIWDATFFPRELKPAWGHSTWEQGASLGKSAGAKTVLMTHFSHQYNDAALREQECLALAAGPAVRFVRERMELKL